MGVRRSAVHFTGISSAHRVQAAVREDGRLDRALVVVGHVLQQHATHGLQHVRLQGLDLRGRGAGGGGREVPLQVSGLDCLVSWAGS